MVSKRRNIFLLYLLITLLVTSFIFLFSINTGTYHLSFSEMVNTLIGQGQDNSVLVLFEYRLPRILIALVGGAGIAVAGSLLQSYTGNHLADTGLLGLHAGASCGLIVFMSFFSEAFFYAEMLIPLFAFIGGAIAAALIVYLAKAKSGVINTTKLILVGIAVSSLFSAITLFLSLRLSDETYSFAASWLLGNIWARDWIHVFIILPLVFIFSLLAYRLAHRLNLLQVGDHFAQTTGFNVKMTKRTVLILAVVLSSGSVSMIGNISFLGLLAPHLARQLVGSDYRFTLPLSALLGAAILLLSDTIGRSLFEANPIPAGILVAFIGGPYFIYLLLKNNRSVL
ncbi:FecCD family ABC transporter permease [Metabacillus bambusae]|uniref:Iron ABC transporter permease n=1 Tax=Metabacillus bambusae TaxID=2795218 RepID=A0ABS3MZE8_9BACI|nr:iron ABC transporter permease [Metabacillus bambusae]MBO1511392.1 iron ABC transporter permease [Metabacillus bambusae]